MEDGDTVRPAGGLGRGYQNTTTVPSNHKAWSEDLHCPGFWRLSAQVQAREDEPNQHGGGQPSFIMFLATGKMSFVSLQYEQRVKNEKKFDVWITRKGIKMLTYLSQRWIGSERLQTLPTFVAINNLTLLHLWRNIQIQTCRPVHLSLLFPMIQYHSDRQWDIMRLTAWQLGPQ